MALGLAALFSLLLAVVGWRWRGRPGAPYFTLMMGAAALWALLYSFELMAPTSGGKMFWAKGEYLGIVTIPVAWFLFARSHTGAINRLNWRTLAMLCAVPVFTLGLVISNGWHLLVWSSWYLGHSGPHPVGLILVHGPWFWIHVAYSYTLLAAGSVMLLRTALRYPRPYLIQALLLFVAVLAPWVGNGLSTFWLNGTWIDVTPFAFSVTGIVLFLAMSRRQLLSLSPVLLPIARTQVLEKMNDGILVLDMEGRVVSANPAARSIFGQHGVNPVGGLIRELLAGPSFDYGLTVGPDDRRFETSLGEGSERRHFDIVSSPLSLRRGGVGTLLVLRDITERERAEMALRSSEERFRTIFEQGSVGIAVLDTNQRVLRANPAFCSMLGYGEAELTELHLSQITARDDLERSMSESRALVRGELPVLEIDKRYLRKNGELVWAHVSGAVLRGQDGTPVGTLAMVQDISERKQAEEALRTSQAQLESAMELADLVNWEMDVETGVFTFNDRFYALYGTNAALEGGYQMPAEVYAKTFVHPDEQQVVVEEVAKAMQTTDPNYRANLEHRIVRRDGSIRHVVVRYGITKDEQGRTVKTQGANQDITDRKRTEEALLAAEEQLRQAHKMEAVGQLAGGIAHDFNNLLTSIIGNSSLVLSSMDPEEPNYELVNDVKEVGERAAGLTKQILAFSRRQILRPQTVCLNEIVTGLKPLLLRTLGEDINLHFLLSSDLAQTEVDPHQTEQVLVNLALNARDAMPDGGHLTIETANTMLDRVYCDHHQGIEPGRYVMLAVTDTGCGMEAETRSHIFEPFFTTKEVGKGTGLGLSMVFGIVRQSGGSISVYSEPGRGSTFKVYLPAVESPASVESASEREQEAARGSETILTVEDESSVRDLVGRILVGAGYHVVQAGSAGGVDVALVEAKGPPDLLLTDIVLPGGVNGSEIAEMLVERYPDLKVLYMSGYTRNSVVHDGRLDEGIEFLEKPFTPEALLGKVRAVLDGGARQTPEAATFIA
ncbi:MAG: PAS domain S-box protein [Actinobacteria bacterium]|nr:PAS domain S-box protein [Actinomycetota bacterium]